MIGAGGAAGVVPVPAGAEPVEPGGGDAFGPGRAGGLIGRRCGGVGGRLLGAHLLDERILDLEERERRKLARLDLDGRRPRGRATPATTAEPLAGAAVTAPGTGVRRSSYGAAAGGGAGG